MDRSSWSIVNASYHEQQGNPAVTGILTIKNRGHALTIELDGVRSPAPLPRSFLNELSDDLEASRRIDQLNVTADGIGDDDVVLRLGNSVRPALEAPHEANDLYASQVMLAFGTYVCAKSAGIKTPRGTTGGLTALQERTAKALIDAHIGGNVSLQFLASACGLSPMHMAHAFKRSVGVAPHRWLLLRRVDRAKSLLRQGRLSLADIALECGFADQSHFTRVFRRITGHTPGAWKQLL